MPNVVQLELNAHTTKKGLSGVLDTIVSQKRVKFNKFLQQNKFFLRCFRTALFPSARNF